MSKNVRFYRFLFPGWTFCLKGGHFFHKISEGEIVSHLDTGSNELDIFKISDSTYNIYDLLSAGLVLDVTIQTNRDIVLSKLGID